MPLFTISSIDRPDSVALRVATRERHLAYLRGLSEVRLAGPYLNAAGEGIGSLVIVETADEAAARALAAGDPYAQADLFASVEIRSWRYVAGQLP